MYGENPYRNPPSAAATTPGTQRRITRYAKNAADARLNVTTRSYVTIAPKSAVTGQNTNPIGTAYACAHSRSKPVGLFMENEISGFMPWLTANGTQPIAHIP